LEEVQRPVRPMDNMSMRQESRHGMHRTRRGVVLHPILFRRRRIERAEVTIDERRVPGFTTSISYLGRCVRRRDAEIVLYSGVRAPQGTSPAQRDTGRPA
jgi:hypothetical protein